uniref:Golgi apparatus membrane protein TVP15 n=1 Tax=Peronospora matthiolae TaxID=2874970 RepID=A0AAV1URP8_9STRA
MLSSSDVDAQERLLQAPLDPQQAAMSNSGNLSNIRQQEIGGVNGLTPLSILSTPSTYWQKMKMMEAAALMRYLRYANVMLAVLQALAGFMGLFNLVVLDITCFFISIYAIIFALLLLAFECRFKHMEPWIRQQFGFLFTYRGRTAFIFAVGFMDFGMDSSLAYFVGLLMCGNAVLSLVIMLFHPQFRQGTLDVNMDPTATYRPAVEETETLLRRHEGLASAAGAYVLHEAEEHPEFMAKMAQSYASKHGYVPPMQK